MSLLVVGLSHRTAPVPLLERAAIGSEDVPKALHELALGDHVLESLVLSTCNRIELYADVDRFHGGVHDLTAVIARHVGVEVPALGEHLYVHYEDAAVEHLFSVAAGLDSMVLGESQILGQIKLAYQVASAENTVGRVLHELCQKALRAGKRVRTDTGIDRVGASLVSVALDLAERAVGPVAGRRALVVGAGSMGALTGATLRRAGIGELVVANRTVANAQRLADSLGGVAVGLEQIPGELAAADLVFASTGATGLVIGYDAIAGAVAARDGRPLALLDLALPRDVDPAAAGLPGVTYVDLAALGDALSDTAANADLATARFIVAEEVNGYLRTQRSLHVAPTVAALRARAAQVVDAELLRLDGRLPGLDARTRGEFAQSVRRVVDKLLHDPTVRVKELAERPGGDAYAVALRELFGLDPAATAAVSAPSVSIPDGDGEAGS